MGREKITIPLDELTDLYHGELWSPARIAVRYGCTPSKVRNRLLEAGVELKSKSKAQSRYAKYDFDGSSTEKAYMLGFRYGDLNVYKPKGRSEIIVVRSHSTHTAQGDLFKSLFERYGNITVSSNTRSVQMNCYLNASFNFLLTKYPLEIRDWVTSDETVHWAFAAGYIDAEATFGLNQGRGRFKIDAYDHSILTDLHALFVSCGINSKFRVIAKKGDNDYGWIWKEDLWRLGVNEARSLEVLIKRLQPFMQHRKRIADARIVLQNVEKRQKKKNAKSK